MSSKFVYSYLTDIVILHLNIFLMSSEYNAERQTDLEM